MAESKSRDAFGHALKLYLEEIGTTEPLLPEREIELTRLVRKGDPEALNELINANLKFVVSVANKYRNTGLPLEDLINEGNIGLIKAAHRFDESRGFKFISYAVWWIKQTIMHSLAEQSGTVKLPVKQAGKVFKGAKCFNNLAQTLGREPHRPR